MTLSIENCLIFSRLGLVAYNVIAYNKKSVSRKKADGSRHEWCYRCQVRFYSILVTRYIFQAKPYR